MTPAGIVEHLMNIGVTLTPSGDHILASPRELLTPGVKELIRANRARLLDHLRLTAPVDLRPGFEDALRLGVLIVCRGCRHFESRPGDRPDGWCRHHGTEAWANVPFDCRQHEGTA